MRKSLSLVMKLKNVCYVVAFSVCWPLTEIKPRLNLEKSWQEQNVYKIPSNSRIVTFTDLLASPCRIAKQVLSCENICRWFSSSTLLLTWREIKLLCACHVLCWPKNLWHLNKAFCKVGWLLGMSSFHSEISSNNSLLLLLHDAQWLKWSGKVGILF